MTDKEILFKAVLSDPESDTPRLAYADLLERDGDESDRRRAELIRIQIEIAGFHAGDERAYLTTRMFIDEAKQQVRSRMSKLERGASESELHAKYWSAATKLRVEAERKLTALTARESTLLSMSEENWWPKGSTMLGRYMQASPKLGIRIRRGFVDEIVTTWEVFLDRIGDLYWHPDQTIPCPDCNDSRIAELARPAHHSRCQGSGRIQRPLSGYVRCPNACRYDGWQQERIYAPSGSYGYGWMTCPCTYTDRPGFVEIFDVEFQPLQKVRLLDMPSGRVVGSDGPPSMWLSIDNYNFTQYFRLDGSIPARNYWRCPDWPLLEFTFPSL